MTSRTARVRREDLVNRHEAAEILGVHPNTIDRLSKLQSNGSPPVLRRYRIRAVRGAFYLRADVEDMIEPEET